MKGLLGQNVNDKRLAALNKLLDFYSASVEDYDSDVEEDLRPYTEGEKKLLRWCCVTKHDGKAFFLLFESSAAAALRAVEYAGDSMFDETPEAIVDLDTGRKLYPAWHTLEWR